MFSNRRLGSRRLLTIMVTTDRSTSSRSYVLTTVHALLGSAAFIGLMGLGYAAGYATSARQGEVLADSLASQTEGLRTLSTYVDTLEARYGRIAELFGARATALSDLWLPPVGSGEGLRRPVRDETTPTSWPLTERGFVTQALIEGMVGEHPGLDIAVPTGSYIRAAGAGIVADAGEDPLYGYFVLLDHGGGYGSLYAHASVTFVKTGDPVHQNEVIALSGSTGRSTAPHLHFEILRDNEPLDPLTIVRQP